MVEAAKNTSDYFTLLFALFGTNRPKFAILSVMPKKVPVDILKKLPETFKKACIRAT